MDFMAGDTNEFDEFDVTEQEFDQMYAESEPVMVDLVPRYYAQRVAAEGYYTLTTVKGPAPAASRHGQWTLEERPSRPSAVPSPA